MATARPRKAPKKGDEDVAALCHALSDPTRLAILDRLRTGEQCVCNLVDVIGGGQSRLSFHLRTLKDAGLVTDRREGRWVHYSLSPKAFTMLHAFVASLERCCPGATKKGTSCC
jgi:ArsR family transcriptional regulator